MLRLSKGFIGATAAGILALGLAGGANAASITYGPITHATSPTNWSDTLFFPKFDPTLGTLTSILVEIAGSVSGSMGFENTSESSGDTVTLTLAATLQALRPDLTLIVLTTPSVSAGPTVVTAFDGTIDFGGTSGATFPGVSGSGLDSALLTSGADLLLFTATFLGETIAVGATATGASSSTGGGNIINTFSTFADASVEVTYNYSLDQIPEPVTLALFGAGLLGLGIARRRRAA